jgi:hypothetical protein
MVCPFCKEQIADGAIKCKHCSSMLDGSEQVTSGKKKPIWASVTSLVMSLITLVFYYSGLSTEDYYTVVDEDLIIGAFFLSIITVVFAIIGFARGHRLKGMSIAGIIIGAIVFFAAVYDLFPL